MSTVAYTLFSTNPAALQARVWQQSWEMGELKWRDPLEDGPKGTFLNVWLVHHLSQKRESFYDYMPSDYDENLALWLLEKGVDPWVNYRGETAWEKALDLGWPRLIKALALHAHAPPKDVLGEAVVTLSGGPSLPAPLLFAERNQTEALKAWSELGLDVNMGLAKGQSAGSRAKTPEFIEAWAQAGGDIEAVDERGRKLSQQWSRFPSAHWVAMERAWLALLPERVLDPVELATQLSNELPGLNKTLLTHRFKRDGLSWDSKTASGASLRSVLLQSFMGNPEGSAFEPSVMASALENATPEQAWAAIVAGLRVRSGNANSKSFPTPAQLASFLSHQEDVPGSLMQLADQVSDVAGGQPLICLFDVAERLREHLPETADLEVVSYSMNPPVRAFWAQWFQEPNEEGVAKGWPALIKWALKHARENNFNSRWLAVLQTLPKEKLQEGREVFRGIQALIAPPGDVVALEGLIQEDQPLPFLSKLSLGNGSAEASVAMESLENTFWEDIRGLSSDTDVQETIGQWLARRRSDQLEKRLVKVEKPAVRARF